MGRCSNCGSFLYQEDEVCNYCGSHIRKPWAEYRDDYYTPSSSSDSSSSDSLSCEVPPESPEISRQRLAFYRWKKRGEIASYICLVVANIIGIIFAIIMGSEDKSVAVGFLMYAMFFVTANPALCLIFFIVDLIFVILFDIFNNWIK